MAIEQIESAAETRCNQVVVEAEAAIKASNDQRDKAVAELVSAQAELQLTTQLKAQVSALLRNNHSVELHLVVVVVVVVVVVPLS